MISGWNLIAQARKLYPGQALRVMTQMGERIILPHELIEEVRNERRMNFPHGLVEVSDEICTLHLASSVLVMGS